MTAALRLVAVIGAVTFALDVAVIAAWLICGPFPESAFDLSPD